MDGVLDPKVELWQDIEPAEPEHEEHLGGPASNAFDLNEEKAANTKLNTVALRKGVNTKATAA